MGSLGIKRLVGHQSWNVLRTTPPVRLARAVRDALRRLRIRQDVRRLWGEPGVTLRADEATVVCLLRDAEYYLTTFLDHYTALGVRQIILLDNGSSDRSLELARGREHVTVLQTRLPYKSYQFALKEYLLRTYGVGGWRMLVDSDELIDYPRSAKLPLPGLLHYLNSRGFNAMAGQLLDMFDEHLPMSHGNAVNHDLRARYPYYDLSNLTQVDYARHYQVNQVGCPEVKVLRGGIRRTLFGSQNWLTKHPLVRLEGSSMVLKDNIAHDVFHANVADVTAVLYHYKFSERFAEQTERAVCEENYYKRSHEYKLYHAVLSSRHGLRILQPTSRRLEGVDELVDQGFLVASPAYRAFVEQATRAAVPA